MLQYLVFDLDGGQGLGPFLRIGNDVRRFESLFIRPGGGQGFRDIAQGDHDQARIADLAHRHQGLPGQAGAGLGSQNFAERPVPHVLAMDRLGAFRRLGQQAGGGRGAKTGRRVTGRVGNFIIAAGQKIPRRGMAKQRLSRLLDVFAPRLVEAGQQTLDLGRGLDFEGKALACHRTRHP